MNRYLRRAWNWLTSMRTALILLFILAFAAIPGALLPQRSLNQTKVADYIAANGTVAQVMDKLQLFDVFSSTWFLAIFTLLLISLVGCIIPRSWDHFKIMRKRPVRTPQNLDRFDLHGEGVVAKPVAQVQAEAKELLRRWHTAEYEPSEDRAGGWSISAERGYLREAANLVFHIAIVALMVAIFVGRLFYYEGQVIVVAKNNAQFCNTATANYDSFRAGPLFDGTGLHPFCFEAQDFDAEYLNNGQANDFTARIAYAEKDAIAADPSTWTPFDLKVNHPLRIAGDRIYLQGHGYAPTVTVTWPNGESRTQTVQFKPEDLTYFLSSGVLRFDPPAGMFPDLQERRKNQITIQGLFAPTAEWSSSNTVSSSYPALTNPAMAVDVYRGDNGLDAGVGQNLFELDQSLVATGQLTKVDRVNLELNQPVTLEDGTTITLEGAEPFANFQVSYDPSGLWSLIFAVVGLAGISGSLLVKRRRIWVRLYPVDDTHTRVLTAGLARTDRAGWGEEYERIHRQLLELQSPDGEDNED